jgi:hypothetical protein
LLEGEARRLTDQMFARGKPVDPAQLAQRVVYANDAPFDLSDYQTPLEEFIRAYAARHYA